MQVGQILVEQRWVEPAELMRALGEQRHTGKRICSLLIARGLLDPDHAARALSIQHNVPGALQRHLDNRDPALASLLPVAIARASFALPIGRTRNHELIVCVRDPRPELRGIIATAVGCPVVLAVAAASQLEPLLKLAYEAAANRPEPPGELSVDVDLSTRTIPTFRDLGVTASTGGGVDVDLNTRPIAVLSTGRGPLDDGGDLGDLGSMTLVGLDDDRVARDPSQAGPIATGMPRAPTLSSPAVSRTQTSLRSSQATLPSRQPSAPLPRPAESPRRPSAPLPRPTDSPLSGLRAPMPTLRSVTPPLGSDARPRAGRNEPAGEPAVAQPLQAALTAIGRATTLGEATDAAMRYVADHFRRAVLFTIRSGSAVGDRGHGGPWTPEAIRAIAIPLSAPSIVQAAYDTRRPAAAVQVQPSDTQDQLARTLDSPELCTAIPVKVGARVAYVIAVGDRTDAARMTSASVVGTSEPVGCEDVEWLAGALGAAYQRFTE